MKKILFFALALVAGALAMTSCDPNNPDNPGDFKIEEYVGTWHLDSMVADGGTTIRPIDVQVVNDTLLAIGTTPEGEPQYYKWSHADGKINAPWIWSSPLIYVDYTVVSYNTTNVVLRKEDNGTQLFFTHQTAK